MIEAKDLRADEECRMRLDLLLSKLWDDDLREFMLARMVRARGFTQESRHYRAEITKLLWAQVELMLHRRQTDWDNVKMLHAAWQAAADYCQSWRSE
jgi:hypothetical protein